ncbi:hypothetical protein [Paraliomyxa miuraensis]|uniref:hypothetical protein n=1 Tax=Paraliomyxa miuraensis TaxID=376150 RepID=UPI00225AF0E5|nr:hypothetical protein [Paraliomyxa miuraensis]MCX4241344.1 hypothetical protein [Paraliomyxa miuraensis]
MRLLPSILVVGLLVASLLGSSCIIPDEGIVGSVYCGARWCATAEFAEALQNDSIVQVQETQSDGTTGWVTRCICMTPAEDAVLQTGAPQLQYELLRAQIIDATRQACLDVAIANGLEPDPPYPFDEWLEPSCYEAVTTVFHDGCCSLLSTECGGQSACHDDATAGEPSTGGGVTTAPDTADTTAAADSSTGDMSSLEPFYAEVSCSGTTCRIGQPLIDAMLSSPEAVLAEGTSLSFFPTGGPPLGLRLHGVEPDNLAGRLGFHDGDLVLRVAHLPLTTEAELLDALALAQDLDDLTLLVLRDGTTHERRFLRQR